MAQRTGRRGWEKMREARRKGLTGKVLTMCKSNEVFEADYAYYTRTRPFRKYMVLILGREKVEGRG
jgi:hypothetical protein